MSLARAGEGGFMHKFIPADNNSTGVTLLLLHGTGGDESDLLELGRMLLPGAALLGLRGNVLENGMPRFFRRLAEGVFDIPDLLKRTHELADFVAAAAQEYHFDAQKVIAVGYSNGANIAASTLLLRPETLAQAALFHAMVPFEPEQQPDLSSKQIFISAGRNDPIVPRSNTERLIEILQSASATVTSHWSNSGHTLTHEEVRAAQTWINDLHL